MSDPTPPLDEFLAAYDQNDNEWWYLEGGDHLNLFDEALDRMRAAEAAVVRCRALAGDECWVTRSTTMRCTDMIGGGIGNAKWTAEMCCLPCRVRAALDGDA